MRVTITVHCEQQSNALRFFLLQTTTEKHRMSFPETVDEILDVSEDEGTAAPPPPSLTKVVQLTPTLPFSLSFLLIFCFCCCFFRNRTANVRYGSLSSP